MPWEKVKNLKSDVRARIEVKNYSGRREYTYIAFYFKPELLDRMGLSLGSKVDIERDAEKDLWKITRGQDFTIGECNKWLSIRVPAEKHLVKSKAENCEWNLDGDALIVQYQPQ